MSSRFEAFVGDQLKQVFAGIVREHRKEIQILESSSEKGGRTSVLEIPMAGQKSIPVAPQKRLTIDGYALSKQPMTNSTSSTDSLSTLKQGTQKSLGSAKSGASSGSLSSETCGEAMATIDSMDDASDGSDPNVEANAASGKSDPQADHITQNFSMDSRRASNVSAASSVMASAGSSKSVDGLSTPHGVDSLVPEWLQRAPNSTVTNNEENADLVDLELWKPRSSMSSHASSCSMYSTPIPQLPAGSSGSLTAKGFRSTMGTASCGTLGPSISFSDASRSGSKKGPMDFVGEWPLRVHHAWHSDDNDDSVEGRVSVFKSCMAMPHNRAQVMGNGQNRQSVADFMGWGRLNRGGSGGVGDHVGSGSQMGHRFSGGTTTRQFRGTAWIGRHRSRLILDPSSSKRILWDILGIVFILYDCIFIPLTIFNLPESTFMTVMQMSTFGFWALDMVLNFFTGYLKGGVLVTYQVDIARNYLKTFFFLDFLLVTVDIISFVLGNLTTEADSSVDPSGAARVIKTYRIVRILRGIRLLRVAKLSRNFAAMLEYIQHEWINVIFGIVQLTLAILMLNHIIACVWYGICTWEEGTNSWVDDPVYSYDISYLYMTALHWSLTQFTPASMEVMPTSKGERLFSLIIIVFGMVISSSFVSSITNAMTRLRHLNNEHSKSFLQLQRYLRHNAISLSLGLRVRRHLVQQEKVRDKIVQEKDVQLFHFISMPLLIDLRFECYAPPLRSTEFFSQFEEAHLPCLKKVCYEAIAMKDISEGDHLFDRGDEAKSWYIVKSGLLYYSEGGRALSKVEAGDSLAEAVLWTPWVHRGQARAKMDTTLMVTDSEKFHACCVKNRAAFLSATNYANLFVEYMNTLQPQEINDLSDPDFDVVLAAFLSFAVAEAIEDEDAEDEEDDWDKTFSGVSEEPSARDTLRSSRVKPQPEGSAASPQGFADVASVDAVDTSASSFGARVSSNILAMPGDPNR